MTNPRCPEHDVPTAELVGLNSKREPVMRCRGGDGPPHCPHYFMVTTGDEAEAATKPARKAKK